MMKRLEFRQFFFYSVQDPHCSRLIYAFRLLMEEMDYNCKDQSAFPDKVQFEYTQGMLSKTLWFRMMENITASCETKIKLMYVSSLFPGKISLLM